MNIALLLRISVRSLAKHKGRSFLTILGIIIGITAIIATVAIGKGAEEKTRQQFLSMGNNYIVIHSGSWLNTGKSAAKKRKFQWLHYRDAEIMQKLCPMIQFISPNISTKEKVSYRTNNIQVEIKSGNEFLMKILDRKIRRGMFFTSSQAKNGARVAVLGSKSAKELFNTLDPIGKTIRIKDTPFTVIGVMKRMENFRGMLDPNFDIMIPIKAAKKGLYKTATKTVHRITISAPSKEAIPILVQNIRRILRFQRKIKDDEPDNFTIIDQASLLKAASAAAKTIRLLLIIIASISLLVGGIGIMNIMLVSVTERTREIGIRMALGATGKMILRQFLIEAMVLCLIGGALGTYFGISIPYGIAKMTNWSPIVTPSSIIVALITTSLIGIFFGFYPARKASKLSPVDALAER